jgi:N-acetyl-alpha-D-muramate 1-phosphate uridylyltransferase
LASGVRVKEREVAPLNAGASIETAMVLAAGFGTRMRPITDRIPKPLVRLAGRPLIDHVLDRLAEAGIKRAVVNVHHFADQVEEHLDGRDPPQIILSDEREAILETGGGVFRALPHFGGSPFLVHNSDSVWRETRRSNLRLLMEAWDPGRMAALLLLANRDSSIGYEGRGDFHLASSGNLTRRRASEVSPHVFAGVSILKPELFSAIADRTFSLNVIFDRAIARDGLYGVELDGVWMHVGTPQTLLEAESYLNEGKRHRV